jgi:hypothetical protein
MFGEKQVSQDGFFAREVLKMKYSMCIRLGVHLFVNIYLLINTLL